MEIILTPEQKQEDIKKRVDSFNKDLKALIEKHQIDITAVTNLVTYDLKFKEK
jgi:hypothetical protein